MPHLAVGVEKGSQTAHPGLDVVSSSNGDQTWQFTMFPLEPSTFGSLFRCRPVALRGGLVFSCSFTFPRRALGETASQLRPPNVIGAVCMW